MHTGTHMHMYPSVPHTCSVPPTPATHTHIMSHIHTRTLCHTHIPFHLETLTLVGRLAHLLAPSECFWGSFGVQRGQRTSEILLSVKPKWTLPRQKHIQTCSVCKPREGEEFPLLKKLSVYKATLKSIPWLSSNKLGHLRTWQRGQVCLKSEALWALHTGHGGVATCLSRSSLC
jgi:hypothetical protein